MEQDSNLERIMMLQNAIAGINRHAQQVRDKCHLEIQRLNADKYAYARELNLLLCRLNPELIELAKKILCITGPVDNDIRRLLVIEAIQNISQKTELLRKEYIGIIFDVDDDRDRRISGDYSNKDHDWKSACYFNKLLIGLNEEYRSRPLNESEIEACLYYLYKIEDIQRAEARK